MRFHRNDWFISKHILISRLFYKITNNNTARQLAEIVYRSCIKVSKIQGVVNVLCAFVREKESNDT